MGIMVYSVLLAMEDVFHQPYGLLHSSYRADVGTWLRNLGPLLGFSI